MALMKGLFVQSNKVYNQKNTLVITMASQLTKEQKLRRCKTKQRNNRKLSLMKKVYQYSILCNADVCLGIRLRENGKVFTFQSDGTDFWSAIRRHLVC